MKLFLPNRQVGSLEQLDPHTLFEEGIRLIVIDADNTLLAPHEKTCRKEKEAWIQAIKKAEIRIVLISNNIPSRISSVDKQLKIEAISLAFKPLPFKISRYMKRHGFQSHETCLAGDQLFTDITAGNLLGLTTILVEPIVSNDYIYTRWIRVLEKAALSAKRKQG